MNEHVTVYTLINEKMAVAKNVVLFVRSVVQTTDPPPASPHPSYTKR